MEAPLIIATGAAVGAISGHAYTSSSDGGASCCQLQDVMFALMIMLCVGLFAVLVSGGTNY